MTVTLDRMKSDAVLGSLQLAFAKMIGRIDPSSGDAVLLAAALVSEQLTRGHVCLDLASVGEIAFRYENGQDQGFCYDDWPALDVWLDQLAASAAVTVRECDDEAERIDRPLVLDRTGRRLYLGRYWYYQQRLARIIADRVASPPLAVDETRLASDIAHLFPNRHAATDADQCLAAASVVDQRLSVITGGPGTGKTTTVTKLIALRIMHQRAVAGVPELRVLLMAPTGKAAQRLNESLGRVTNTLEIDQSLRDQLLSIQAGTIHRLLRWTPVTPERGGPYTHDSSFPLEADVVLVDEASMVDVSLMWHLLCAVPSEAQIILMGDRDQLASVEAGSVLGDLCGGLDDAAVSGPNEERRRVIARRTGLALDEHAAPRPHALADHVISLRYSHRFAPTSGLGRIAAAIRAGDADRVIAELRDQDAGHPPVVWIQTQTPSAAISQIVRHATTEYTPYLECLATHPEGDLAVIRSLLRFRVLCAHREGLWGELNIDRMIAENLDRMGLIRRRRRAYWGQPLIVTRNDYRRELFNGDVGVVVRDPRGEGLTVLFESAADESGCRRVPTALVPESRSCYALTIHKAQGSEFHHVMIVLPREPSPILTRELLYTGVTRVADERDPITGERRFGRLYLVSTEAVLRETIERRIRRSSGLSEAIEAATR